MAAEREERDAEAVADDESKPNALDNAVTSFSLAPDGVKFVIVAVVTAVIVLLAIEITGGSDEGETPDGFIPQTPELEQNVPEGQDPPGQIPAPDGAVPR